MEPIKIQLIYFIQNAKTSIELAILEDRSNNIFNSNIPTEISSEIKIAREKLKI